MKQINEQGGLLDGQDIVMPTGDTTCSDASAASNAADRMVNTEQVTAIVGALCTGATVAAANNAAVPGGVTMVSPASTAPAVTDIDDNDLVFRTVPSDAFQGKMLAKLLLDKGIEEVVVTYVNNDYGSGLDEAFTKAFEAGGGTVAENLPHEDNRSDYRAELGRLSATGVPNLVVLAYADTSGQTVVRQAYESGMFTQYIGADGMVGDSLVNAIGADVLDGMIATRPAARTFPAPRSSTKRPRRPRSIPVRCSLPRPTTRPSCWAWRSNRTAMPSARALGSSTQRRFGAGRGHPAGRMGEGQGADRGRHRDQLRGCLGDPRVRRER